MLRASALAGPGFDKLSSLCCAVVPRSLYRDQSSGLGLLQGSNLSFPAYCIDEGRRNFVL